MPFGKLFQAIYLFSPPMTSLLQFIPLLEHSFPQPVDFATPPPPSPTTGRIARATADVIATLLGSYFVFVVTSRYAAEVARENADM